MNDSIQTIINDAPRMISAIETLAESTQALRNSANEFNQSLNEGDAQIKQSVADSAAKIESLRSTADDSRNRIKNRLNVAQNNMEELNSRVTESKDEVVSELTEASESMNMFLELVENGKNKSEQANNEAEQALDAFFEMVGQGGEEMRDVVDQTAQSIDTLAIGIEEAFTLSGEQMNNLTESVDEIANQAGTQMSDLVENSLGTAAELLVTSLDGVSDEIAQNVADIFQKAQDDFLEGVKGKVDDVVERTSDSIESQVSQVILGEADRAGIERAIMEPAVDALTDVMDPVVESLEYITDLASSVGISI